MPSTYWRIATSKAGVTADPSPPSNLPSLQPPTSFRWEIPEPRYTINGTPVEMGRPLVRYTWNAMRPETFYDLTNLFNPSGPVIYIVAPIEHNLIGGTYTRVSGNIVWGIYRGIMNRPLYGAIHTGASNTGWRQDVTLTISQIVFDSIYSPSVTI